MTLPHAELAFGAALIVAGSVIVLRDYRAWVRRLKVLWFLKGRLIAAFFAVYVVGFIPICAHLFATAANEQLATDNATPVEAAKILSGFGYAIVADAYLYAFIVAMAGCVEAVTASRTTYALVFVVLALVSGFGNYNAMLDVINRHPIGTMLASPVWVIMIISLVGYGGYKLFSLYGAASVEWEAAQSEGGG